MHTPSCRRHFAAISADESTNNTPYIGRSKVIDGERHHVLRADPDQPGNAIITSGDRQFSTTVEMGAQAAIWSSTRRPPFDNAKSRLTTCNRHVVGNHRLSEALEGQRANLFGYDASP